MSDWLSGLAEMRRNLANLGDSMGKEIGRALYEEAQVEKRESMRRTPVDTGALKASHEVGDPQYSGRDISVEITVGGPSAPYAIYVHEDLEALHPSGQSKFLESTINESAPYMAERVGKRIDLNRAMK